MCDDYSIGGAGNAGLFQWSLVRRRVAWRLLHLFLVLSGLNLWKSHVLFVDVRVDRLRATQRNATQCNDLIMTMVGLDFVPPLALWGGY